MPAIGTEQARGHREECGDHARYLDVQPVDVDQILRQPQRQRDEGAENEEVIQREPPHLNILERLQLQPRALRPDAEAAALHENRIVLGGEEEDDGHHHQRRRPHLRHHLPAKGDEDEGGEELGDRRAHVAGAEDAKRRALLLRRIPARDIGDAHRERSARDADAEGSDEELRVGGGVGQQEGCDRRREHGQGEDDASAIEVGPDAQRHADERAREDGRAHQEAELRVRKPQVLADADADDGEDRPHRKAYGEGDGAHGEGGPLVGGAHLSNGLHGLISPVARARLRRAPRKLLQAGRARFDLYQ